MPDSDSIHRVACTQGPLKNFSLVGTLRQSIMVTSAIAYHLADRRTGRLNDLGTLGTLITTKYDLLHTCGSCIKTPVLV